jgi:hypothetical protein
VGPRAGLDVCEKSRAHRDFFYNASFVRILYFFVLVLDLGTHAVKIRRLRSGANTQTWVPEAGMLTTIPPKPLGFDPRTVHPVASRYTD